MNDLAHKHKTRMKIPEINTSLFGPFISYRRKKFCNIDPWIGVSTKQGPYSQNFVRTS